MKRRKHISKNASKRKFTNTALQTKNINLSARPRRGGIRM